MCTAHGSTSTAVSFRNITQWLGAQDLAVHIGPLRIEMRSTQALGSAVASVVLAFCTLEVKGTLNCALRNDGLGTNTTDPLCNFV